MNILITGDSHTGALRLGLDLLASQDELPATCQIDVKQLGGGGTLTKPFFADRGTYAEMTDQTHLQRLTQLPVSGVDYQYYGFCGPLHTVRKWRHKGYWSQFTPLLPKAGEAPVSKALLTHIVKQDQRYIMQLLELLKRVDSQVVVIEAPRPFRHHAVFEKVSVATIMYVDGFYRDVMRNWLNALAVPIVSLPKASYDEDGFMLEIFKHDNPNDGYHGNNLFGALMLKEFIGFVQALENPPPHAARQELSSPQKR